MDTAAGFRQAGNSFKAEECSSRWLPGFAGAGPAFKKSKGSRSAILVETTLRRIWTASHTAVIANKIASARHPIGVVSYNFLGRM
jgi:hypothetical protein